MPFADFSPLCRKKLLTLPILPQYGKSKTAKPIHISFTKNPTTQPQSVCHKSQAATFT